MERTLYIICGRYFEDEPAHNITICATEKDAQNMVAFLENDALNTNATYWYEGVTCYGI